MKKINLLFGILYFVCIGVNAQTKIITVDTPDEFVDAIGSNRTIQLKGSTIYLSNISQYKQGTNYYFSNISQDEQGTNKEFVEEHDGHELKIFGVNNLKIIGLGDKPVKIITKPVYGNVIVFENCNNITIENVDAGHGPGKGSCTGGVFNISNSKNFNINKSIMYGSGMEGITAFNVTGLKCNNSIIKGCTYSVMTLNRCNDFEFDICEFTDNKEFDLINISNCINVKFDSCSFTNNQTGTDDYSDYAIFNVSQSMSIVLQDCMIESNLTAYFCRKANTIELTNTILENNLFKKGNFKE
jgi:hypothetical protein